jgi:hypothetical protein
MLAGILLEFLLDACEVFFAIKRLQALRYGPYGVGGCIHRYIVKFQGGSVNSFLFKSYLVLFARSMKTDFAFLRIHGRKKHLCSAFLIIPLPMLPS